MKSYIKIIFAFFAASILFSSPLWSEESLSISAQSQVLPSTTVPIAEKSQIIITLFSNHSIAISTVAIPEMNDFKIIKVESSPSQKNAQGKFESLIKIDFMPLTVGEITFQSLSVPYKSDEQQNGMLETPPVKMTIVSTISGALAPQMLRDISGPIDVGMSPWVWIVLFSIILILIAGWVFYRHRKKIIQSVSVPSEPPRPPDEVALEKLDALFENYKKNGDQKIFYSELSNIFREYLSGFYLIDTLEKTTTEIFSAMRENNIGRKICLEVKEILSNSDLVKFAKYIPTEKNLVQDFDNVKSFIEKQRTSVELVTSDKTSEEVGK